jgi:DNA-binding MarR family transcriptional regulator
MTKSALPSNVLKAAKPKAFYRAETYNPEESLGSLMRQILNHVSQQVEQQLAHTDLTDAQWKPLFKLYMGDASTIAELARDCLLDAGAMTRTLDRLEAKDLCRRVRSETDRRVVNIALTEIGRTAAAEIPHVLSRVQNANLRGFSVEEFETLKGFLQRILANAKDNSKEATPTTTIGKSDAS